MLRDLLASDIGWWLFYVGTILLLLLVVELGYRVGRARRSRSGPELKEQSGTVLTTLLALLGFLLAISFALAADRFGARKALVLQEANAIGTTWLRADFLPEPQRSEVRNLLQEYVALRVRAVQTGRIAPALARSEQYHEALWRQADAVAESRPRSVPIGLFVESLNEVIDLHQERLTVGLRYRIPPSLLWTLYLIALLSMGTMGAWFGLAGTRSVLASLATVVSFAAVLLLILDLDQPRQHLFTVVQDPLMDTLRTMEQGDPAPDNGARQGTAG